MRRTIRIIGDPVLNTKCNPVPSEFFLIEEKRTELASLLQDMNDTMVSEAGIGLAANQVGVNLQIFILKKETAYEVYINPEIVSQTDLTDFNGEACLSIPGTSATTRRFNALTLKWQNIEGITNTGDFNGIDSFAIQHEMDHLAGKLYINSLPMMRREMTLNKHKKFMRLRK